MPNKTTSADSDEAKTSAHRLFHDVREQVIAALHRMEDAAEPPLHPGPAGRIRRSLWRRGPPDESCDLGGGEMGLLSGRLFEKAGAHFSAVYGPITDSLAEALPGASGEFWASGVSVILHPRSPKIPAAHMNVRMISTERTWFGGGADLTPVLAAQRYNTATDTRAFHAAMEQACALHPLADHPTLKANCDSYFHLAHRGETRGTGGIFFDRFASGDTHADLLFLRAVAERFIAVYETIVRRCMQQGWSTADREEQLRWRGRYVEFNLLYDRGTRFGLASGGNVDSILSSLPPVVKWA